MKINYFPRSALCVVLIIAFVFLSPTISAANAKSTNDDTERNIQNSRAEKDKARFTAESEAQIKEALENGCTIIRETKGITALICSRNVATSLGLREDLQLFATDLGANIQIGADKVQATGDTGSGRKIAVFDSGCNYYHPDLSSSCLQTTIDFVNNDSDPLDDNGHGSHVAGLITGDGSISSSKGVAPGVQVIPVKVLGSDGSGFFSDVVAGIYWVVDGPDGIYGTADDLKADAISLSIGTSAPYLYKGYCDNVLPSLTQAIKYAVSKGVVVVVAAGNSGAAGVSIPGCISYSLTVGAVDKNDSLASFSGRGRAVDIVAPGISLVSAWLGEEYVSASGTSMATPVISGTVALIKYKHPEYTPAQVEAALFKTAKDLGKKGQDQNYGYGRVDAFAASSFGT